MESIEKLHKRLSRVKWVDMLLRPLLSCEQIRKRILEMGAQIDVDYPDDNLFLICILKGACYFLYTRTR